MRGIFAILLVLGSLNDKTKVALPHKTLIPKIFFLRTAIFDTDCDIITIHKFEFIFSLFGSGKNLLIVVAQSLLTG